MNSGRKPSEPVIQNIPIRTETGKQLQEAFMSKEPKYDFSAVEKRLAAMMRPINPLRDQRIAEALSKGDTTIFEGEFPEPLPPTPECDKLSAHHAERLTIRNFLEWLSDEKHIRLASYGTGDHLWEAGVSKETLIMEYLEVDEVKLEEERRALLEWQRRRNAQTQKT